MDTDLAINYYGQLPAYSMGFKTSRIEARKIRRLVVYSIKENRLPENFGQPVFFIYLILQILDLFSITCNF